ncbi:Pleckstrin homology domain-containing family A member 7 [Labeo rohita]|uniref:Pleckstrin homology domain-containing family A member 7 n=1 Tax=Labeo rohita TaxID=84645 RepID=A0ABQ8MIL7_LABRO|nr:Pleckstrin homology domain-containing family A member 7 [Labeo rohita]
MAAPLGRDTLPEHWSYGVCRDGRVFFINDKTRGTTWLHPRTGEPVNSGHMIRSDLPRGWEEGFTEEGASYFINGCCTLSVRVYVRVPICPCDDRDVWCDHTANSWWLCSPKSLYPFGSTNVETHKQAAIIIANISSR